MFFFFLSRKQHGSVCSVDGGQEETRMWGKFWLDRLREQRVHLFWTLVDGQPKEEEVGRAWKPGHMSVKRLWSCKARRVPASPGRVYSSLAQCLIRGQNPQGLGAKKIRHIRRTFIV